MIRLAWRGLLARRIASGLAAAGLLTAVSGFLVLTGVSRTTQAVLSGDIARAWEAPYDLLIRPPGTQTSLEATEGLVRPNFLAGIAGGITSAQLDATRGVPGVTVAAPIAMVGFVQWPAGFPVDLGAAMGPDAISVLRVTVVATGEAGLSRYPAEPPVYLVAAPAGRVVREGTGPSAATYLEIGTTRIACTPTIACYGGRTAGPDGQLARPNRRRRHRPRCRGAPRRSRPLRHDRSVPRSIRCPGGCHDSDRRPADDPGPREYDEFPR
ncbi:MAG: hypothetical protein C4307_04820 [Chloroflexota bacterium]